MPELVTITEAAYATELTAKQVYRVVGSGVLAGAWPTGKTIPRRCLVALKLAHTTLDTITLEARRHLVEAAILDPFASRVGEAPVIVELGAIREAIRNRLAKIDRARASVRFDAEIASRGWVLAANGVPLKALAACRSDGASATEIARDIRVTAEQVELGLFFFDLNPRRGRPPKEEIEMSAPSHRADHLRSALDILHHELQQDQRGTKLESFAAMAVGRILGVEVVKAKTGFQFGGDAGPAGRQGRRFRIECKRYAANTALSDRELLGEIDQALMRDSALEAWVLVATTTVPEQLRQDLTLHGERLGVPVVILSWAANATPTLAALCAAAPDVVASEISAAASIAAGALAAHFTGAIAEVRRDLQSWALGFSTLRALSHAHIQAVWRSKKVSLASLGQDVAGGERTHTLKRPALSSALSTWWSGAALAEAPAALLGSDGVGKTWVGVDWLHDTLDRQPIILVAPSSTAAIALRDPNAVGLKRFLADRLHELSGGTRDADHWLRRVDRLLERPTGEGPVFTLFLDGLNQEPSVRWEKVLQVLQGPGFDGLVRVIISTRRLHLAEKLSNFVALAVKPVEIAVDPYDIAPGGELDQMLASHGLSRTDFHEDLLELARTPRLFNLVVRLREKVSAVDKITLHRLLWEYGRDSFGDRTGRSFSEAEWRGWLQEIAGQLRQGVHRFTRRALGESTQQPEHGGGEVFQRLSDIIDGRFTRGGVEDPYELLPIIVAHALAAALLSSLRPIAERDFDYVDASLTQWLDPIAGLDQRAEILRAAVSILIERGDDCASPLAGVLVTAWLQTQNLPDPHRAELAALAPLLTSALLDTLEHSQASAQASARVWAVAALREIPRSDEAALHAFLARGMRWFASVELDKAIGGLAGDAAYQERRRDYYRQRIGTFEPGRLRVLGWDVALTRCAGNTLTELYPSIIEGFPMAPFAPLFELAAIGVTIHQGGSAWDGLRWLLLLNEIDPQPAAHAIRDLAAKLQLRTAEPGIHAEFAARAAARMLWITGFESDDHAAEVLNPALDKAYSYEADYLADPSSSWFELELRHADDVLNNQASPLRHRLRRTAAFWTDPAFAPPATVIAEIRQAGLALDPTKLDSVGGSTSEDIELEALEPVLARTAPDVLADLGRRKLELLGSSTPEQRYWRSIHAVNQLVLVTGEAAAAARTLRLSGREADTGNELFASSRLVLLEVAGQSALEQFTTIIEADLGAILTDLGQVLTVPTVDQAEQLVAQFGQGTKTQRHHLLCLFSFFAAPLTDVLWDWLMGMARNEDATEQGIAFRTLEQRDAKRFGRQLLAEDWSWSGRHHFWVNHYGSAAIIAAGAARPFDQIAPRLAPWRVLEAARRRGADPSEVRLAAEIFAVALEGGSAPEFDPGATLTVNMDRWSNYPNFYDIEVRTEDEDVEDPIKALDPDRRFDAWKAAWRRATETAQSRIADARAQGADLYLADVSAVDFEPVWRSARDVFDRWLDGADRPNTASRRRIRLAESVYISLVQTLLEHDPERGALVWENVRQTMTVRYVGSGGVEQLIHVLFKVTDSPPVDALRERLLSLDQTFTDKALDELAYAAVHNGRQDWLLATIASDRASPLVWRQRRGQVLEGALSDSSLPVEGVWRSGPLRSDLTRLLDEATRRRHREATCRHWWRAYLQANTPEEAYAAWVLFLATCDKRIWHWIHRETEVASQEGRLHDLKMAQAEINRSDIERAAKKHDKDRDKEFLGEPIVSGIGPWAVADPGR